MSTIIKNACIVTCDKDRIITNGYLRIENGKIVEIGSNNESTRDRANERAINANGKVVMPGLVNAHMHLYSQFAMGMIVPRMKNFSEILEGLWWRLDKVLTHEDVYFSGLLGLIQSIKNGVTTVIDHHASYGCTKGSLSHLAKAFQKTGVRGALCYEVSDRNGEKECEKAIEENINFASNIKDELLRGMFGLHASFTISKGTFKKIREINKNNLPYHVHCAEGTEDKNAVKKLFEAGMLTKGSIAAHCIHVDKKDIELLKRSGVFVVHNPVSNMNNAVGQAPYLELCKKEVPVGIGTDGMSAGIWTDVKTASVVHKNEAKDPQVGWNEVQKSALTTNAQIASSLFGKEIGKLKEGAVADLIIVDHVPFTEITSDNYWAHLLFGVANARVHSTIVNGKVVMENYELIGIDENEIVGDAKKLAKAMWKKFRHVSLRGTK